MTNRIDLQPAYVLHSQAFQNTSLLVDFFCLDYGRVRAVARGARRAGSKTRSQLQPFQPLLITLSGRGEVKTLNAVECSVASLSLNGMRLFSGLYMNELLTRLLQFHESHTPLYQSYQKCLMRLHGDGDIASVLRQFEVELLRELGYALNLLYECDTEEPIQAEAQYQFLPEIGFQRLQPTPAGNSVQSAGNAGVFNGHELIALREYQFENRATANAAKRLLRLALQVHLGDKPLSSRRLFLPMSLSTKSLSTKSLATKSLSANSDSG